MSRFAVGGNAVDVSIKYRPVDPGAMIYQREKDVVTLTVYGVTDPTTWDET